MAAPAAAPAGSRQRKLTGAEQATGPLHPEREKLTKPLLGSRGKQGTLCAKEELGYQKLKATLKNPAPSSRAPLAVYSVIARSYAKKRLQNSFSPGASAETAWFSRFRLKPWSSSSSTAISFRACLDFIQPSRFRMPQPAGDLGYHDSSHLIDQNYDYFIFQWALRLRGLAPSLKLPSVPWQSFRAQQITI